MNELNELKAQAYDCLAQIAAHQRQIQVYQRQVAEIEAQIANHKVEMPPPVELPTEEEPEKK